MAAEAGQVRPKRRRRGLRRALSLLALLPVASRAPVYARLMWALGRDSRIPRGRKAILLGAVGYVASGRDILPDDLPLLGGLDDLVVMVLAIDLFFEGIPEPVLDEQLDAVGLDRDAFQRDIAQVRRLMPRFARRAVRELPRAARMARRAIDTAGLGPRLRDWITKEESFA